MRQQPGTAWEYSIGPDIQARLVEVLSGMPFDEYLQRHLFQPLKMKDAGFFAPPAAATRLVPVSWMNKDHHLVPLDEEHGHPDGGFLLQPEYVNSYTVNHRRKGGSYGLVGTAEDPLVARERIKQLDPDETIKADLGEIAFDKLGEAMGAYGERVSDPKELEPALRRALASGRAAVLHVDVDPVKHMWAPGLLHFKKMHEEP